MDAEEIMGFLAIGALIVVPALAISIRISLKPIVEAVLRLHEGLNRSRAEPRPDGEQARLREQVELLEVKVQKLMESEAFYRELRSPETEQVRLTDESDQRGRALR